MPASLKALALALRDLAFPPACLACAAPLDAAQVFCPACAAQMEPLGPACPRCGRPARGKACACQMDPPPYDRAVALAVYGGPLRRALHQFKYGHRLALGHGLGRVMVQGAPRDLLAQTDLLLPVPLHPWRMFKRGFNQSLLLARALSQDRGLPLLRDGLRRTRHTRPQVGLKRHERAGNVAGAFAVRDARAELLRGRRVLLVDDVFTSGATVGECARVLKQAGAASVMVLTLARVAPGWREQEA